MDLIIRVIPRASKSEIVEMRDGVLKVRITAPPVEGAANAELLKLLARYFGVAKAEIAIISGASSRMKRVRVNGASEAAIQRVLRP